MSLRQEYLSRDALGLAAWMESGDVSAEEVLETAIEIAADHNPRLNAIVAERHDQARAEAAHPPPGPLSGVPFLLKDLYVPFVGLRLTNGSRLFADHVPQHDSVLARRYREAGLVVLGRSASPEFGLTTSTESRLHGPTRNPWNLEHGAGGSSGGSSAAVAAGIVPAAHASDGGGSIRIPAACCGLVGLKPTRARITMAPDTGEGWAGLSTHHVVSRTVRDTAALLDLTRGSAPGDPYHAPPLDGSALDRKSQPTPSLRVALTTRAFNGSEVDPECAEAARRAAHLCEELGHPVHEAAPEFDVEQLGAATRTIVGANIRATMEMRAEELGRELSENDVEPATWAMAQASLETTAAAYARATKVVHAVARTVGDFFEDHDILLSPTMACPPPKIGVLALDNPDTQQHVEALMRTIGFTQLMNVAGNPAISLPLAQSRSGLPLGVQFAAAQGEEHRLLKLAFDLEEGCPWADRRAPGFGPRDA